ncbi:hypothetical protein AAKU55_004761 [Oxalobacteraceae bacterium GrIS 1.11]
MAGLPPSSLGSFRHKNKYPKGMFDNGNYGADTLSQALVFSNVIPPLFDIKQFPRRLF